MARCSLRRLLGTLLSLIALLALPAAATGEAPAPQLYRVTLAAPGREARSQLAAQGVAIDAAGPDTVLTVVDAEGLADLRRRGIEPLAVTPLDFPPIDADYHNYAELMAALNEIAAARPDIVRLSSAGASLEGRALPAVKISDDPDVDDPDEPAVLFMALTHAREHLTVEMALAIVRLFAEGHGRDPELTNLVEQREIWVLPNVNPDGGEYDIATGNYRYWRKNRRLNADFSVGVDLNRNYGYRWGGGGASPTPSSDTYRGPAAFSEPETQIVRDFVLAHPDITAAISFHTYGELILYPYGYTYEDLPVDMDADDHAAFVALAQNMAATNGYTPQQASDLYVTSGDTVDWLYGERRIFGFTFEMFPVSANPGFYPRGAVIPRETARNIPAVIQLTAAADAPRKVIGLGGDTTAPEVTLAVLAPTSPRAEAPIGLSAAATDDVAVTLVAWQVDGETVALDRTPPYETTWTPTAASAYQVQALAFDAGGNLGASETVTITVAPKLLHTYLPWVIGTFE